MPERGLLESVTELWDSLKFYEEEEQSRAKGRELLPQRSAIAASLLGHQRRPDLVFDQG